MCIKMIDALVQLWPQTMNEKKDMYHFTGRKVLLFIMYTDPYEVQSKLNRTTGITQLGLEIEL